MGTGKESAENHRSLAPSELPQPFVGAYVTVGFLCPAMQGCNSLQVTLPFLPCLDDLGGYSMQALTQLSEMEVLRLGVGNDVWAGGRLDCKQLQVGLCVSVCVCVCAWECLWGVCVCLGVCGAHAHGWMCMPFQCTCVAVHVHVCVG